MKAGAWSRRCVGLAVLALACACQPGEEAPVSVAKSFESAVRRGDVKAIMELADAASVADLEARARTASDQVGGRRKVEAHEMLQIVDVDPTFETVAVTLVDGNDERASVALESSTGQRHVLQLVHEAERGWRVALPRPPAASTADSEAEPIHE